MNLIIIDKPYVSEFLKNTLKSFQFPVLRNEASVELLPSNGINFVPADEAVDALKKNQDGVIYTSSENSVGWIAENLVFSHLPEQVNVFKDKVKFRELLSKMYPDIFYKAVSVDELDSLDLDKLPMPFIIKPTVGFFSLGVYRVSDKASWPSVRQKIKKEIENVKDTYPQEVVGTKKFIIEEIINGDEYTIDAYFDRNGKPVILGMMKHIFASAEDMSDRLYITSKQVIYENFARFTEFLEKLGSLVQLKNFPLHVEVRVNEDGKIVPIEVNPLRFGGWCTSAELTHYAYGFNPYQFLMENNTPDWQYILSTCTDDIFSIIILNNNTGLDANEIESFDYDKLLAKVKTPLELRKVDARKFHIYGFLYARTRPENFGELERMLHSDLNEFIQISER
jgi:hypothetical protein